MEASISCVSVILLGGPTKGTRLNYVLLATTTPAPSPTGATDLPGSPFDPTAVIALILSIVGLLVTILLRYLDGPRVRIVVRPVLLGVGGGGTLTYFGGKWPIPPSSIGAKRQLPRYGEVVELAEIVIENAGRHPMTVYEVGFRWFGGRRHWWRRRVRHSVVPTPIRPPWITDPRTYATGDRFRIEPSDVTTVLVDYWSVVRANRPSPRGAIKLRGGVRVAGRRRMKQSSKKARWHIGDNAATSIGTATRVPVRSVVANTVALALLRSNKQALGDISFFARSMESALEGAWTDDWKENHAKLELFKEESPMSFALYSDEEDPFLGTTLLFAIHNALDEQKGCIDWSDIAQPDLHEIFSEKARARKQATADEKSTGAGLESSIVRHESSTRAKRTDGAGGRGAIEKYEPRE